MDHLSSDRWPQMTNHFCPLSGTLWENHSSQKYREPVYHAFELHITSQSVQGVPRTRVITSDWGLGLGLKAQSNPSTSCLDPNAQTGPCRRQGATMEPPAESCAILRSSGIRTSVTGGSCSFTKHGRPVPPANIKTNYPSRHPHTNITTNESLLGVPQQER